MRYASVMAPPLPMGGSSRYRVGTGLSSSPHTPPASVLPLPAASSPTQSALRKAYQPPTPPSKTTCSNTSSSSSNSSSLTTRPFSASSQGVGVVSDSNAPRRSSPLADARQIISSAAATHISTFYSYDDDDDDDDDSDDDESSNYTTHAKSRLFEPHHHVDANHVYHRCCCGRRKGVPLGGKGKGKAGWETCDNVDGQYCQMCTLVRRSRRRMSFAGPHMEERNRSQTILPEPLLPTLVRPLIGDTSSDDDENDNDDIDERSELDGLSDYDDDDIDDDFNDLIDYSDNDDEDDDDNDNDDDSDGGVEGGLTSGEWVNRRRKSAPIAIPHAGESRGDRTPANIGPVGNGVVPFHPYLAGEHPSLGFLPPAVRRRATVAGNDIPNSSNMSSHTVTAVPSIWNSNAVIPGRPETACRSTARPGDDDFDERFFY